MVGVVAFSGWSSKGGRVCVCPARRQAPCLCGMETPSWRGNNSPVGLTGEMQRVRLAAAFVCPLRSDARSRGTLWCVCLCAYAVLFLIPMTTRLGALCVRPALCVAAAIF